jgi:hypothetical protein
MAGDRGTALDHPARARCSRPSGQVPAHFHAEMPGRVVARTIRERTGRVPPGMAREAAAGGADGGLRAARRWPGAGYIASRSLASPSAADSAAAAGPVVDACGAGAMLPEWVAQSPAPRPARRSLAAARRFLDESAVPREHCLRRAGGAAAGCCNASTRAKLVAIVGLLSRQFLHHALAVAARRVRHHRRCFSPASRRG